MKKRLLIFFIVLFQLKLLFTQDVSSIQKGTLKGKIIDSKSKEALGGVSIYVDGKGATTSNPDGNYSVKIPAGNHSIEYKFIGYKVFSRKVEVKANDTNTVDIALDVNATELGVTVISAGKFEQKLEEVTVSMDVMKQSVIQNKNPSTMENVMKQCPGVDILNGQANIRGGSGFSYGAGSRVMVLVDDMPLLTGDAGDVKWDFIPIENIEQVEVIKGASSALFGSSALNGVINFRTSYPKDTAHTSVTLSSGFYNNPRNKDFIWWKDQNPIFSNASVFHSQQFKNFDLVLGGNVFFDQGYRQLEVTQRYRFNFGTRYRFQKVKGLSAGVNGNYMDTHGGNFLLWKSADSAYYPKPGSLSDYHTTRATVDPFITYFTPNGNKHTIQTRFFQTTNLNNTNQESTSNVYYIQYQYQLHLKKNLTVTSGVTDTYSKVISDSLYGNHFSQNVALFTQWDKKFDRFIFSLGARAEHFKEDTAETKYNLMFGKKNTTLPVYPVMRAGINYRLASLTHLRASFGQGYRFPSVAEKFISTYVSGLTVYPNPEIQPETGWSAEIGAQQAFKISNFHGYVDVAGFEQQYKNMMEFTFNYWVPPGTPNPTSPLVQASYFGAKSVNVGQAEITGTEFTVAGEGKIGAVDITVLGGYTYILPVALHYDSTGTEEKFAPNKFEKNILGIKDSTNILKYRYQHTAKMDLQAEYKKWIFGCSMRYNSFMKNIDKSFQEPLLKDIFPTLQPPYQYILPGLEEYRAQHDKGDVVFDFRISYLIAKGTRAAIVINNLFNREYMGRPGDMQPPRTFALMLSVKL